MNDGILSRLATSEPFLRPTCRRHTHIHTRWQLACLSATSLTSVHWPMGLTLLPGDSANPPLRAQVIHRLKSENIVKPSSSYNS